MIAVRFASPSLITLACAAALVLPLGAPGSARAEDPAPKMVYQMPMTKKAHYSDLGKKVNAECNDLYHLLLDRATLLDPEKRKALLVKVKPMLAQFGADARQLAVENDNNPSMVKLADGVDRQTVERLAMLGDEETIRALNADAAGPDPKKARVADAVLIKGRWELNGGDPAKQTEVIDALEKLDRAHPDSHELAALTVDMSDQATTAGLHDRLVDLLTDVMTDSESTRIKGLKQIRVGQRETHKKLGQPFVLAGTMPDGKPFTSDQWKGKVILVDFWATWCGPCKEELPNIKSLYAQQHDKGLEILGVSNDYSLDELKKFTAANDMPWPQLVDADAAAKRTWNPMTLDNGIGGIPRLFLIGRDGKLIDDHVNPRTLNDAVAKALAG